MKTASSRVTVAGMLFGWMLTALPLHGQTINGVVKDGATKTPVADASIVLLDRDGRIQRGTLSELDGSFTLVAPKGGRYTLRIGAAGYTTKDSPEIKLEEGQTEEVAVMLVSDAVVGAPPGFFERMERGEGVFVSKEQIAERSASLFTDALKFTPAVKVIPLPLSNRVRSRTSVPGAITTGRRVAITDDPRDAMERDRGGRSHYYTVRIKAGRDFNNREVGVKQQGELADDCVPVLWVNGKWWGPIDLASPNGPDGALTSADIEGIEIYNHISILPDQFNSGRDALCGVIVVWTSSAETGKGRS
jgi:hypothetical protein